MTFPVGLPDIFEFSAEFAFDQYSTTWPCRMGNWTEAYQKGGHSKPRSLLPTPRIPGAPRIQKTLHQVTRRLTDKTVVAVHLNVWLRSRGPSLSKWYQRGTAGLIMVKMGKGRFTCVSARNTEFILVFLFINY